MLKHLGAQALFDSLPDAAIILDRSGKIKHMNGSAHKLFQYEFDEIKGQPIEVLIPARFRIRHIAARDILLRSGSFESWGSNRKQIALRKDGKECHVLIKLSMLSISDVDWVICLVHDLTTTDDLEQDAHELQSQFQWMAWLLQADASLPEGSLRQAVSLESYYEHVAALSLGYSEPKSKKILIRDLVDALRKLVHPHIERAAADLIVEELGDEAWVHFSPSLLQMALLGLVKICAEAVSALGERWVKLGLELQEGKLLMTLTDSAYVMTDENCQQSALEICVARSLLERYGGQLMMSMSSHSRFSVSMPIQ